MLLSPSIRCGNMCGGHKTHIGRWILSKSDLVIAVSKSNDKEVINNGLVDPCKVKLIYNAVDCDDLETIITKSTKSSQLVKSMKTI